MNSIENNKIYKDEVNHLFNYDGINLIWKNPTNRRLKVGSIVGCIMPVGYMTTSVLGVQAYVHRLIYLICKGYLPDEIDHVNGDVRDNRIENLRACTKSENQHNKKIYKNNKSGIKGVSWCKKGRCWVVQITSKDESYRVSGFPDKEVAEQVAKIERLRIHKNFTNHG